MRRAYVRDILDGVGYFPDFRLDRPVLVFQPVKGFGMFHRDSLQLVQKIFKIGDLRFDYRDAVIHSVHGGIVYTHGAEFQSVGTEEQPLFLWYARSMTNEIKEANVLGAALVLEGGGMRGLYTAGVLDCFLDRDILFRDIIGVSAGASHALSYVSRQRGRARRVNVDYCRRRDYMGLGCLIREGSLFGMDLLFRKIPFSFDPYDFAAFEKNSAGYQAVATSLTSGTAHYFNPRSRETVLAVAQASCSLPLVSRPVFIDGEPFLDGGIGDSIPVGKALADGQPKAVIILTQPKAYRKGPTRHTSAFRLMYRRYPEFVRALETRNESYNETLDYIDQLETEGRAFVIRPKPQTGLRRLERDPAVLDGLYRSGYADATEILASLEAFVS